MSKLVLKISNRERNVSEDIKDKEIRVINSDGSQLGIMLKSQATKIAEQSQLDLIEIAAQAVPPVYKIMDYGKYCFDKAKKEKEAKKNQRVVDVKEIRLSVNIDTHDFNTKVNHAMRFVKNGDKVKVSIRFKGREMGHSEIGYGIMNRFSEACSEFAVVEKPAKLEGANMLMFLVAKANPDKKSSKQKRVENVATDTKSVQSGNNVSSVSTSIGQEGQGAEGIASDSNLSSGSAFIGQDSEDTQDIESGSNE